MPYKKSASIIMLIILVIMSYGWSQQQRQQRQPQQLTDEQTIAKAKAIHAKAITLDAHALIKPNYATVKLDPGSEKCTLKCTLPKMEKGQLKGVFLAAFVAQGKMNEPNYLKAYKEATGKIEAAHRLAEKMYPQRCELALKAADVERIAQTGKRAIIIGVENGYSLGQDIKNVEKFFNLGVRSLTLSHKGHNQICDSCNPGQGEPLNLNNGLSDFGRKVVMEMNRWGIICDSSHISDKSFADLIATTKAPIIASHSACRALAKNPRNLTDEQLKLLAKNGGVIQIPAVSGYLQSSPAKPTVQADQKAKADQKVQAAPAKPKPVDIKIFVDHLDHAVKIAGIDHVGIGTDFDGGAGFKGSGGLTSFNDESDGLNVTIELVRRGYSESDIQKIWGGNLLRVWGEVEKTAQTLRK